MESGGNPVKTSALSIPRNIVINNPAGTPLPITSPITKAQRPLDFAVSKSTNGEANFKGLNNVMENEIILDIGPQTIYKIEKIVDTSRTVLWNGPAGYFENQNFSKGTISIAKKISDNTKSTSLISIVGGGDTISAIKNNKLDLSFTHLSTAGGAFLEYIEGKNLPGIEVLK